MVNFCEKCGAKLSPNANFCSVCGMQVVDPEPLPANARETLELVKRQAVKIRAEDDDKVSEESSLGANEDDLPPAAWDMLERVKRIVANPSPNGEHFSGLTLTGQPVLRTPELQGRAGQIKGRFPVGKKISDHEGKPTGVLKEENEDSIPHSSFYLVDFLKNAAKKSNVPLLVYLVLNLFVIAGFCHLVLPFWKALLAAVLLYGVSLFFALSPIGEWMLRLQTGCQKICNENHVKVLMPIFEEVYSKARELDPSIPSDVKLFICEEEEANAFATGRRTICITSGLVKLPAEEIKAALGHEFGHLAHKDTDNILLVSIGNIFVSLFVGIASFIICIVQLFIHVACALIGGSDGFLGMILNFFVNVLFTIFVSGIMFLWSKIGIILVMKTSRDNEYLADEFSFRLGYGGALCALLESITGQHLHGLFANLSSSHPDKNLRIARLQQLQHRM